MKKIFMLINCLILCFSFSLYSQDDASQGEASIKGKKIDKFPFNVYTEKSDRKNHFFASGWMGDFGDLKINDKCTTKPQSGKTCFQVRYSAARKQNVGWSGIYWQNPANNWGTVKGGFDITGAKKLYFYARGEKGGEVVEFKIGGITGDYSDTTINSSGNIELEKTWKLYEIDLSDADLSYIAGGFCFVVLAEANPDGCTFYLDNIQYSDKAEAGSAASGKEAGVGKTDTGKPPKK
ncbi:MAG: hypothetical protein PHF84_04395 [bacterium]|nr:hypothetical protein [bacterium]